ncbi:unnamed protein product [Hermetia illucens]|uniref:Uncharacterized protein n=1 Tax=Hermetia illucens TaxID=343691 RepID=A0A7R8YYY8_HERIL|nr:bis(5'-adenosyl)-triphosphatase enpp4-like [Hermetia illucens]CAD7090634.1 unnamed protein product [Hermetia illucens]
MKLVRVPVVFVCLLISIDQAFGAAIGQGECKTPRLLLVSYDGFSNDYFSRNLTPNSEAFQKEGVYVKRLRPVFPTKTFTNHFTIVTGVYPEVHGVSANEVYDRVHGELHYGAPLFEYNKDIVPIWTLNELANGTSGCMMWPGFDFPYRNTTCTYSQKFDKNVTMKARVDTVMKWFTDKSKPANFVVLYADQPDKTGHRFGTTGIEMNNHIKEVDEITGYIQEQLKLHNLTSCTNVIHLSDHGMIEVNASNVIDFSPFLENGTYKTYGTSPVLQIVPEDEGAIDEIFNRLVNASNTLGHFKVFKQPNLPERWHVKMPRFGPIVAVADLNYVFQDLYKAIEYYKKTYNQTRAGFYGVHGYDNEYPEMSGVLMAKGPSFPQGKVLDKYENIDLYNLFVKILDLPNAPRTNGSYERAVQLLEEKPTNTAAIVVAIILLLIVVACLIVFIIYRRKRYHCMWF